MPAIAFRGLWSRLRYDRSASVAASAVVYVGTCALLPVLRLLRLHLPQSEIFWWIDSGLAALLETDPDLTGVVRSLTAPGARRSPRTWVSNRRTNKT